MLKKRIATFSFTFLILVYIEAILRHFTIGSFDARFLYTVAFCIPTAGIIFLFTLFKHRTLCKIIYNTIIFAIVLFSCIQSVYYEIFGGYCSVAMMISGGGAVTNFATQTANAIKDTALSLILLAVPFIISILLSVFNVLTFKKTRLRVPLITAAAVLVSHFLCIGVLAIGGTGAYSAFGIYCSETATIDTTAQNMGFLVAFRRDAENYIFRELGIIKDTEIGFEIPMPDETTSAHSSDSDIKEEITEYNIIEMDMNEFKEISKEVSETVRQITEAVEWRGGTKKNEYTGMFEGYNLITICAEAYSPAFISEELTPTLYELTNNGFVFENYYGTFESITTNGEYSFQTGMFPDFARARSFEAGQENSYPFTLANMFKNEGVHTYAYHNYMGSYYTRNKTHPNIGYEVFRTPDDGLDMEMGWPSSDLEMMKASADEYINSGKQFHAYYMTFSGHYQYNWENPMSAKHRKEVEHLDYSEPVKAYIACNLELEYALEYLVNELEEAGIADKTVIALTNDHYPYGLSIEEYSELSGREIDNSFEKYRNNFILWTPSIKEPIKIDKLCSTVDILPTLLNLFGFEFDSRFVIGRDILSDHEGLAILANGSFITKDYKFDAVNNQVTFITDAEITDDQIASMQSFVKGTMGLSKTILNTDYYSYYVDFMNGDLTLDNVGEVEGTLIDDKKFLPKE